MNALRNSQLPSQRPPSFQHGSVANDIEFSSWNLCKRPNHDIERLPIHESPNKDKERSRTDWIARFAVPCSDIDSVLIHLDHPAANSFRQCIPRTFISYQHYRSAFLARQQTVTCVCK